MPTVIFRDLSVLGEPAWLCCENPVDVIETRQPAEVIAKLTAVEEAVASGLTAAGFVSYEAAPGFDEAFRAHPPGNVPLVWFGLFREMTRRDACDDVCGESDDSFTAGDWQPSISRGSYAEAIDRIKDCIARGETYQVNYTFRLRAALHGSPRAFFRQLCRAQDSPYSAFVDTGGLAICSASPELFFSLDGRTLVCRPMKGTAPRGLTLKDDRARADELARSPKNRAENAMIVDMMRNDMGRIAEVGSIQVDSAFDVEKYPTVFQMTSTVRGRTDMPFAEIMRALFPPASVTGAPKIQTMRIIGDLEPDPRGVYTGCIGYLAPGRRARFSVAIRTVVIDRAAGRAEYGVGGGVVWDSTKDGEYEECCTKAAILTADIQPFELLETILFDGQHNCYLLDRHIDRLMESAAYFDFAIDRAAILKQLAEFTGRLGNETKSVRLLVGPRGQVRLEAVPAPPARGEDRPWRLRIVRTPVDSRDVFLYHKTTRRQVYKVAYNDRGDADDVVLWNERGEVTETTIANLVAEKAGRLVTPPLSCGLLAGVFRAHLLDTGQIREEIITLEELRRAGRVFAVNSVRKWMPAAIGED
jgi:para-aminobenzoate synthetase / 4-amino-4-deoxychorismate lyase